MEKEARIDNGKEVKPEGILMRDSPLYFVTSVLSVSASSLGGWSIAILK